MLFLLIQIGDEDYALSADCIVEILPLVEMKRTRGTPQEVAGSFNYRGAFVPAVDLDQLELGRPAPMRMGTRIVVVEVGAGGHRRELLGLVATRATETLRCEAEAFSPFAIAPRGLVQRLDIETLLPARLRDVLFAKQASPA